MRTWRSSLVPLACLAIVLPLAARITPPSPTPAPTATEAAATPDASCPAIPLAAADAAAPTTASSPDAWGGPRKADAPTLSDRVVKYTIDATLDGNKTLSGIDAAKLINPQHPASSGGNLGENGSIAEDFTAMTLGATYRAGRWSASLRGELRNGQLSANAGGN